ncbi:MAG: antitoxin Xre/MbcA/ParS toxin-binding domain-containing protein [Gammaproteobacteria bacterium]
MHQHQFKDTEIFPDIAQLESKENLKKLTKMLIKLFDLWQLDTASQLNLLGLSETSRATLAKYRDAKSSLAYNRDALDRAGYLLAMHKALRLLYPHNKAICYSWIKLKNKAFNNNMPLEIIKEQGIIGLALVARYLDFVRGH